MEGNYRLANSKTTLELAHEWIDAAYDEHKYVRIKIDAGKRTLPQNAIKSVWYAEIAKHREDMDAKQVENECKYNFGVPILRRDPANNWIYERTVDLLSYEQCVRAMSRFSITSLMSVAELTEYIDMMKNEYPYLTNEK